MTDRRKKIMIIGLLLVVWFVIADAYWVGKERDVKKCTLEKSTLLISNTLYQEYFRVYRDSMSSAYLLATAMVDDECSSAEGFGSDWTSFSGLAYWEAIILMPVIHSVNFNW